MVALALDASDVAEERRDATPVTVRTLWAAREIKRGQASR